MKPDPLVRLDGFCAQPGCTNLRPIAVLKGKKLRELVKYAGQQQIEADPFCSAPCARKWHGVDIREEPEERVKQRSSAGRKARAKTRRIAA